MARQNRVQPTRDIIAHPARGGFMGNRGILHKAQGLHPKRRWAHRNWVCCRLSYKGNRRELMAPGRYTELFFLDEAVAFAAGHRPCAQCRNAAYRDFRACLPLIGPAAALDRQLHHERAIARRFAQRRHPLPDATDLPDGSFVLTSDGTAGLIYETAFHPYRPEGYASARALPRGPVQLLTPPSIVAAFRNGYRPRMALD
ncbi:hypothetical protein ACFSUD_04120 [Sulfitobacter aestuarii]|uniref:Ada DNA repair metal-binding domain-containing protein n=1 Tax=Sulfitobacter aestuarii TaxID=2161676 RepID=A0ABW5TZP7_9RHOB